MDQNAIQLSLTKRQMRIKPARVGIATLLILCSGWLAMSASGFEDVNMATILSVEGGHVVVRWSTKGYDHYNVRWSEDGGPVTQVERAGDKYFRYLSTYRPGVVYRVAVQGCETSVLNKSQCTSWDEVTCGPSNPCDHSRPVSKPPTPAKTGDTCASGYVWREARPKDHVCVTPASRDRVTQENRTAPQRWNPSGAFGPSTCIQGYVWREAFEGDTVCVSPQRRAEVKKENQLAASRRAR
jgi:hypothetical protein